MDSVFRGLAIYIGLLFLFRVTGKRSLGSATTFDFVLLLLISEAVSSALLADAQSTTGGLISVSAMMLADIMLSTARSRWPSLDRLLSGRPVVLIADGRHNVRAMRKERVDVNDIMEAARLRHSVSSIDEVRTAILESNGQISVALHG